MTTPSTTAPDRSLVSRLRSVLPRGSSLPDADFRRRHHVLLVVLWAQVVGLPVFGLAQGISPTRCLVWGAVLAVPAVVCTAGRNHRAWWVSATMAVGLLTSSAVLVSFWDGRIEAHFHFFVMIVLLTLYEEWLPFILAALYVALHHGVVGVLAPDAVYDHASAQADPWGWAAIHAGFIVAAGIAAVAAWRLNEDVREERQQALDRAIAAERELARSNAELEQFAGVASHDLSEPLRTVTGFMQLLETRYGERLDERGRGYVAHAIGGAARMQRLIDGLLDLSRVGHGELDLQPVQLAEVVSQACDALAAQAAEAGGRIDVAPDLPLVLADQDALAQALQNVISNALKFPRPGRPPHVRITCAREERTGRWCVRIADDGIGVPAAEREEVFGMFHRLHGVEHAGGAGIGLAVVARVAERHGGRVWMEETPGGGTTVALTLAPGDVAVEPPTRRQPPTPQQRGARPGAEPVRSAVADLAPAGD